MVIEVQMELNTGISQAASVLEHPEVCFSDCILSLTKLWYCMGVLLCVIVTLLVKQMEVHEFLTFHHCCLRTLLGFS